MKAIIEQQVSDIIEITKLLSNGTTEEYTNNINVIKDLSNTILDKLCLIEREMYALSDNISTQEEIDAVNAHLQSLYGDKAL